ncbi:peptidylprolyl isomerase [Micromonospora sp. NPDC049559]|uniref:peptidylprolyl isomerase n=1 Tax=Micromonospora sp. NPDC049559 TaxID=3155923 RepID=UPI0034146718
MASSRDRQRKLARAKLDRQMARRAASARRKRQVRAGVGAAVALVLIVLGSVWALGGFDREPKPQAAPDICAWTPQDASANSNLKDVGTPATSGLPTSGTRPMTITTNQGAPVTVELDLANSPCAGASFAYLAGKSFFDNTKCHEITTEGAVHCGDPSGTGQGGPTYTFVNENVPAAAPTPTPSASATPDQPPAYPAGTVAMFGNPPGANGSQFLIFFKDFNPPTPSYPIIGKVTAGLDVIKKIGSLETVDNGTGSKVKPKTDVVVQSLTVGEVASTAPTAPPTGSPAPSGSASPSASPVVG